MTWVSVILRVLDAIERASGALRRRQAELDIEPGQKILNEMERDAAAIRDSSRISTAEATESNRP